MQNVITKQQTEISKLIRVIEIKDKEINMQQKEIHHMAEIIKEKDEQIYESMTQLNHFLKQISNMTGKQSSPISRK